MRIAFVSQWFPPEPGNGIAAGIADGLATRGHNVDVITGFPNYPTGKIQQGYPLRAYRREQRSDRVAVHRAPLYPSHDRDALKRIANYSSFALSACWVSRSHISKPDIWLTYSSPATSALPSLIAWRREKIPSFLLIQDLWPDSVLQSEFLSSSTTKIAHRTLEKFCNWTYRRSAGIGIISPGMRAILVERGVDDEKIYFTPNWVGDTNLQPTRIPDDTLRSSLGLPVGGMLFMYAGNLGQLQGLAPLVEAFSNLAGVNLVLIGDGVESDSLRTLVETRRIGNISFVSSQMSDIIGHFIAASDVQIVSLRDNPSLRATMPSKVQTSMAAGRPILCHAAGDVAHLVTSSGAGLAAQPGNLASIRHAILAFSRLPDGEMRAMGRRARAYYEKNFSPSAGLDRLESMLLTDARSGARR